MSITLSTISSNLSAPYNVAHHSIVVTASGHIYVFYVDTSLGAGVNGLYTYSTDGGSTWSVPATFNQSGVAASLADLVAIDIDSSDIIHVIWDARNGSDKYIYYRTLDTSTNTLSVVTTVDSTGVASENFYSPDLYVDDTGVVHAAYAHSYSAWNLTALCYAESPGWASTWIYAASDHYVRNTSIGPYNASGTDILTGFLMYNTGAGIDYVLDCKRVSGVWSSGTVTSGSSYSDVFVNRNQRLDYTTWVEAYQAHEAGGVWASDPISGGTELWPIVECNSLSGQAVYVIDFTTQKLVEIVMTIHGWSASNVEDADNGTSVTPLGACCQKNATTGFLVSYQYKSGGTYYLKFYGKDLISTITVYPSSIASSESFGSSLTGLGIFPAGIATLESFGPILTGLRVSPAGIPSVGSFGSLVAGIGAYPSGIASHESFGALLTALGLFPTTVPSMEAFGSEIVHKQITSLDVPVGSSTDVPINWETQTTQPGLPPVGWNNGGTTRSQPSTNRYSPTHLYKSSFMMEIVLGSAGGNMSSMAAVTDEVKGKHEYKASFRLDVYIDTV